MIDESEKYVFKRYEEDEWQILDSNKNELFETHVEPDDYLDFENNTVIV